MDEQQNEKIYSVSEINTVISSSVTKIFDTVNIHGEVSNVKLSREHLFFKIKDTYASIEATFWNYTKKYDDVMNEGEKITVTGKLSYYVKSGTLKISCENIIKEGTVGEIHKQYENMKKKFIEKGYFEENKKKIMPSVIKNVGIITAKDGAAIQDILYVFRKNNFKGNIYIKNCVVQGDKCPFSVVSSIDYFKKNDMKIDVLLITRGGGAFEDLMGFSDEIVVKSIYKSDIFIMSAVGHEVDNMLSDYVADYRAPTPSIAAEIISSYWKKVDEKLNTCTNYVMPRIVEIVNKSNERKKIKINGIMMNMYEKINKQIDNYMNILVKTKQNLLSINYDDIITQHNHLVLDDNLNFVTDCDKVLVGQKLKIKIKNKMVNVTVDEIIE